MDLVCDRIKVDMDLAIKIIKHSNEAPQIYINKAIQHHFEIAYENLNKLTKPTFRIALQHPKIAINYFNSLKNPEKADTTLLAACAKHEVIAEKLIHHSSDKVRATCAKHKNLYNLFEFDRSPLVLASVAENDIKLALELKGHKSNLVRRACVSHKLIAKKLVHKELDAFVIQGIAKHHEICLSEYKKTNCRIFLAESALFPDIALDLMNSEHIDIRSNCATHLNVAQKLVNDKNWLVRKECAKHNTLQNNFIQDREPFVRSICATNKELCHLLLKDEDNMVCKQLALNPYSAQYMVNHHNQEVADKARFTVKIW